MRHNNEPHITISSLPPHRYALVWESEPRPPVLGLAQHKLDALKDVKPTPSVVCPFCGHWGLLCRGMLLPHCRHGLRDHVGTGCRGNCHGSGQRYSIDVSFQDWSNRLAYAVKDTDTRSAKRPRGFPTGYVCRDPAPPVPVPVCRPVVPAP